MERTRRTPLRHTLWIAVALLALWLASWAISYASLGAWSLVIAIGIAALKALLVVLVFMELAIEPASVRVTLLTGLTMVAVLMVFMMLDVETRETPPLEPPSTRAASFAAPRR